MTIVAAQTDRMPAPTRVTWIDTDDILHDLEPAHRIAARTFRDELEWMEAQESGPFAAINRIGSPLEFAATWDTAPLADRVVTL